MRFLTITLVLVLFMGGASFVSVMTVPAQAIKQQETARNPASFPEQSPSMTKPEQTHFSKLEDLAWDCKGTQNSEMHATHVRLKGKTVCQNQTIKEIKIRNLSNGFTATVFANDKGFLTDFIDLQVGANNIKVDYVDKQGKSITADLTVLRK